MSDYISRESVLNTIEDMDKALDTDRTVEEYKALLIECIKALPSRDSITELEKIHEEISERLKTKDESQFDLGRKSELAYLGNLINEHIAELKGEKCEDFDHEGFYNFLLNTIQPNEMEEYRNMFLSSGEIVN